MNLLYWYGPVCPRAGSVYKESLFIQSETKQDRQKYQPQRNSTYRSGSIDWERNRKFFAKVNLLREKTSSCFHIQVSKSQSLFLDAVETGVLLSDFVQQLLVLSQPRNPEEVALCIWHQKMPAIATYCPICTTNQYEKKEKPNSKLEKDVSKGVWIFRKGY